MFTKKRNVLFIVVRDTYFRTAFTLGDKAANLILNSNLPETIKNDLSEAKKYAEGRTIQIEVKTQADIDIILEMTRIKLTH